MNLFDSRIECAGTVFEFQTEPNLESTENEPGFSDRNFTADEGPNFSIPLICYSHLLGVEINFHPCLNLVYPFEYSAYTDFHPGVYDPEMVRARNFLRAVEIEKKAMMEKPGQGLKDVLAIARRVKSVLDDSNPKTGAFAKLLESAPSYAPDKAFNGRYALYWQMARYGAHGDEAGRRVLRDLATSAHLYLFPNLPKLSRAMMDACGSLYCLFFLADLDDYVEGLEAEDGISSVAGGGKPLNLVLTAANDGLKFSKSRHIPRTLADRAISAAFLMTQRELLEEIKKNSETSSSAGQEEEESAATYLVPERVLHLKWWGTDLPALLRGVMGYAGPEWNGRMQGPEPDDMADGNLPGILNCPRVRRAIHSYVRLKDILDIGTAVAKGQYFNELLVTYALGGEQAVKNYGWAADAVVEDVIECQCEVDGHGQTQKEGQAQASGSGSAASGGEKAKEGPQRPYWHALACSVAQGACVWSILNPRHQTLQQVFDIAEAQAKAKEPEKDPAEKEAPPKELRWPLEPPPVVDKPFINGEFLPGSKRKLTLDLADTLHRADWSPTWVLGDPRGTDDPKDYLEGQCTACKRAAISLASRLLRAPKGSPGHRDLAARIFHILGSKSFEQKKLKFPKFEQEDEEEEGQKQGQKEDQNVGQKKGQKQEQKMGQKKDQNVDQEKGQKVGQQKDQKHDPKQDQKDQKKDQKDPTQDQKQEETRDFWDDYWCYDPDEDTQDINHEKEDGSFSCFPHKWSKYAKVWHKLCTKLYDWNCAEAANKRESWRVANVVTEVVEVYCRAAWQDFEPRMGWPGFTLPVDIYMAADECLRKTYEAGVYGDGAWRRQLFIGLLSTFFQLSPVPVFPLLLNQLEA